MGVYFDWLFGGKAPHPEEPTTIRINLTEYRALLANQKKPRKRAVKPSTEAPVEKKESV